MLHFSQLSRQAHVDEYYVRKQKLIDVEMKSFEYELETEHLIRQHQKIVNCSHHSVKGRWSL